MRSNAKGFTLLEVILSIAILTTIAMLTINVLSSELFLRQKIIARYPFDKIISRIANDIAGSLSRTDDPLDKQINFVHSTTLGNSSLFFTVINYQSLVANTKESNLARMGYLVENKDNKKQLIRIVDTQMDQWRYIPSLGVGVRSVLVEDLVQFKLTFWKDNRFIDEWNSEQEQGKLPPMVKISLTFYLPESDKRTPPKKQEIQLEQIVYLRNSLLNLDEKKFETYTWQ